MTQKQQILAHLRLGKSLTARSAMIDLGVAALPRRIADLKEEGYDIVAHNETNKLTGRRYVRYAFAQRELEAA